MTTIFGKSEGVREKRACTRMSNKQDLVTDFCQLIELGKRLQKPIAVCCKESELSEKAVNA